MKVFYLICIFTCSLLAQEKSEDYVYVPKKYVSQQGMTEAKEINDVSKWVGIGKEIGIATREGLNSVVDVSEKFGTTNVGHFVMFVVAWKVLGIEIKRIVLGIPFWFLLAYLWTWGLKRFYFGRRELSKINEDKSKEYKYIKYEFSSTEGKGFVGVAFFIFAIVLVVFIGVIIL